MKPFWRLTMECAHYRFWGPGHGGMDEPFIGDVVQCDVCPKWKGRDRAAFRMIAIVEALDPASYREPDSVMVHARLDYLDETTATPADVTEVGS